MIVTAGSARDLRTLRVTFDGVVHSTGYTAANYIVWAQREQAGNPLPGAAVTVLEVLEVSGSAGTQVDLVVSDELSPLVNYLVTVTGVTGVAPPYNKIVIQALEFPTPSGRDFDISSHFEHITPEEVDLDKDAFLAVCDDILKVLMLDVDLFTDIVDPDVCEEAMLDLMLADMGNPFSQFDFTEIEKRRMVRLLLPIAKQKGTGPGIVNVIRLLMQMDAEIIPAPRVGLILGTSMLDVDWVLGYGTPFAFQIRIVTSTGTFPAETYNRLVQIVEHMKSAEETVRIYACLAPPRNLVANVSVPNQITLTWDPPVSGDSGDYMIAWKRSPGVTSYNAQLIPVAALTYTVVGVPTGQTRYFVVSARDADLELGIDSNEVVATAT